ncbi:ATP-binding protein [Kibdelosporangium phytohabitans]|uniref:AfsR family transcriptional regulator n=1 Tax=Kibdelosporangium phytohabitans TaxID=860235 RepID=A0A0N9I0L7_9PSEU|nr:BTAD domain-containing putative transcriptional regulator [Kibdelosporangium phytohabitans]ALG09211.1 AfsR family transcriptional regulator [Kibdelosporangium phytohabitans]MBE1469555.1 putative ATPase/DNA-binding SARP family transcriptional activator [Kibdelosporangium phytohabitans]
MRYGVLGPLVVWADDGGAVPVPEAKVRALLAHLLLHDGGPISADRLVADLWGEAPPRRPLNALQAKVSQLRRVLGRDEVVHQAAGYRLRLAADDLDAHRFEQLARRARAAEDTQSKVTLLTDALALWRAAPYLDVSDAVFARGEIARLEELRLSVLEDQAEARLELGEHAAVAAELADLVERHPLRERLRMTQMRALYQSGRQSEALTCFQDLRCRLDRELGVAPGPEITGLHDAILRQEPRLALVRRDPRTNLPAAVTTLIGRQDAIDEVRSLVDAGSGDRAVTLVGPGGVGKTRLAVAAAQGLVPRYPDGVWLMEFAGVSQHATGEDIAERIIATLGLCDSAASTPEPVDNVGFLCTALKDKRPLLVLDNCEHVVEPVACVVAPLLAAAPDVRVLVTSHEALDIPGETVRPVPPLRVSDDPAEARDSAAVELFVQRAAAAVPGFALDEGNADAVVTICRRLDGIPLALELVAPRLRVLGLDELAARLDDRFTLPLGKSRGRPARQQTLRAMIDWSWELLSADERTVLSGLAVHPDGCTLPSATTVCVGLGVAADQVLGLVSRLVDRSLVVRDGQRFRLLESVAAYCLDRLRETGALDATRDLFVSCYLEVARNADKYLRGRQQPQYLRLLDTETVNLRRALDVAADGQALRLVNSLAWYWFLRGRFPEARRSLTNALARSGGARSDRATARAWLAGFALRSGMPAKPRIEIDDPVLLARMQWFVGSALGGPEGSLMVGSSLANTRAAGDRWGEAVALIDAGEHERALELFVELGDHWGRLRATRSQTTPHTGDHEAALRIAEDLGLWTEVVETLCCLGDDALDGDDRGEARKLYDRALHVSIEHSYARGESLAKAGLARIEP